MEPVAGPSMQAYEEVPPHQISSAHTAGTSRSKHLISVHDIKNLPGALYSMTKSVKPLYMTTKKEAVLVDSATQASQGDVRKASSSGDLGTGGQPSASSRRGSDSLLDNINSDDKATKTHLKNKKIGPRFSGCSSQEDNANMSGNLGDSNKERESATNFDDFKHLLGNVYYKQKKGKPYNKERYESFSVDCATQVDEQETLNKLGDIGNPRQNSAHERNASVLREHRVPLRSFCYPRPPSPKVVINLSSQDAREPCQHIQPYWRRGLCHPAERYWSGGDVICPVTGMYMGGGCPPVEITRPTYERSRVLIPAFDHRTDFVRLPSLPIPKPQPDPPREPVPVPRRPVSIPLPRRREGCSVECVHCMQKTVVAFNVIFQIFGLAIVGVAIWLLVSPRPWSYLRLGGVEDYYDNQEHSGWFGTAVSFLILSIGVALFLFSFFGLLGAVHGNRCLLVAYLLFLTILLLFTIGLLILVLVHHMWVGSILHGAMTTFLANEYDGGGSVMSKAWNTMQVNLQCCGVDGRDDWVTRRSVWYNVTGQTENWRWPKSCCPLTGSDPDDNLVDPERCRQGATAYTATCYTELTEWLRKWGAAVCGSFFIFFAIQLIILILAGIVQHHFKLRRRAIAPQP